MDLELHIGAHVECHDGPAGKLRQVVLDRATEAVTHLIVDTTAHWGHAVLVPRSAVVTADHDHVQLSCTQEELRKMDPFEETVFLPPDRQHPTLGYPASDYLYAGGMGPVGIGPMGLGSMRTEPMGWQATPPFVVEEHLPEGGAAIGPDAVIAAADGELGRVAEVLTDPDTGMLTHLVVRRGHLFGAHTLVVPASAIIEVTDGLVRLRFTRGELEAALRPSGDGRAVGGSVVGLFATRQQTEAAITALTAGGFPVEAISAAAPEGQAVRFPIGRDEQLATGTRSVAIGATVGDAKDVVLFGHLAIVASVTTGGLAGVLTSLGASAEQAQHVTEQVRAGHFLVAVHTAGEKTSAESILGRTDAREVHHIRP